jgi:hypothetical protein
MRPLGHAPTVGLAGLAVSARVKAIATGAAVVAAALSSGVLEPIIEGAEAARSPTVSVTIGPGKTGAGARVVVDDGAATTAPAGARTPCPGAAAGRGVVGEWECDFDASTLPAGARSAAERAGCTAATGAAAISLTIVTWVLLRGTAATTAAAVAA